MSITLTIATGSPLTVKDSSGTEYVIPAYAATPAPVLLSTTPADNATDVSATSALVATFNKNMAFGTGLITLQELYDGSGGWQSVETFDVTTDVGSSAGQVEIVDDQLFIRPTSSRVLGREYGIRIPGGALEALSDGVSFEGINNNQEWTWFTVSQGAGAESLELAPTYDGLAPTLTPADLPYDFAQHVTATPVPAYSGVSMPSGVSIGSSTGSIADAGTFSGSASATITANNGITPNADAAVEFAQ